jgi:hypothetical protein
VSTSSYRRKNTCDQNTFGEPPVRGWM